MKLSLKVKTAYGVTAIADQCLFYLYGTFYIFYLTTVAGISPAVAGVISAIGAVWDALVAPISGYISDNVHSRFGKRKPMIMVMAFPMAIATSLLFTHIDASMTFKIIYYIAATMLYWTAFPLFFIPFLAWGAELTEDYNERTLLRSFAYVGNTAGMAIGTLLPTVIVDYLMNLGKSTEAAWHGTIIIVGVCVFISLFFGPAVIKERSNAYTPEEKAARKAEKRSAAETLAMIFSTFKEFKEVLKLRPLRYLIYASTFYLAATTIFASDRMFYFTYKMEASAAQISIMMAVATFSGVCFIPVVVATRKIADKRKQFVVGMLICAGIMLLYRFLGSTSLLATCIMLVAFDTGNMLYWQLLPAMIYDVCELDELVSGKQRQGTIVSLQSLSESLSEAAGMLVLGIVLQLAGFDKALDVQTETALFWVSNSYSFVPSIFMLFAVFMIYKYPITRERFNDILKGVERKRNGETVDLSEFRDVI